MRDDVARTGDEAPVQEFKRRMDSLESELHSINKELGRQDLLALADRTRELLRNTRGLMEGNVTVLFRGQPPHIHELLVKHIEYAEGHIHRALQDEYEFEAIKQRLYMATSLSEYVIRGVRAAVEKL